jgi:hypothetical protein
MEIIPALSHDHGTHIEVEALSSRFRADRQAYELRVHI